MHVTIHETVISYGNFSSLSKIIRIVAYCTRFCKNCKTCPEERLGGLLTANELQSAILVIAKDVRRESFNEEMDQLRTSKSVKTSSRLMC